MSAQDAVGPARQADSVESLSRALAVLELIDEADLPVTASEVARAMGIALPIALRLLRSLTALGHLEYDDRRYRVADGSLALSWTYLSALNLESVLRPALSAAARIVRLPVFFAVLTLPYVYHVDTVLFEDWRSFNRGSAARAPAHVTSAGHVLLAELDPARRDRYLREQHLLAYTEQSLVDAAALGERLGRVREQGFAVTDGDYVPGLRGLAVPVRDAGGTVIGTFSVSTNALRTSMDELVGRVREELLAAAAAAQAQYRQTTVVR